ncbi:GGDEF domain-containing protein [Thalassotalea sp. LPB0316]|uniref:sensor domain-containing diguanylate cyclase n=1 Tax=Thalassotalea sp. LPB0316 TaxID=2769490 RepID=UPI001866783E|nr:sensor domain-containing diguanylate cyclase [Thalassotalea sp. LPB0316]QOL25558.1 GGDEF domain-containing protein [Thalassotalea sp. LPB0316]
MKLINRFDHYITAVFFVTIFAIVATSYFTFKTVISTYNKQQQDATIPLFSWINSEVISPLTLSTYMAQDPLLIDLIEQDELDEAKLNKFLEVSSQAGKLRAFIALEKHNIMMNSEGLRINFQHQDAEWYQRIKKIDQNFTADIGDSENPTLYYDVKIFNEQGLFCGFTGVGVDLDIFAEKLTEFKNQFGFEVYFVDEESNITLSTNSLMKTESHHRRDELINIASMPWYKRYEKSMVEKENEFDYSSGDNIYTVTHLDIEELRWKVFVVAPSATGQKTFWLLLMSRFGIFVLVALILYFVFFSLLELFKKDVVADANLDNLTGLPNRSYVQWKFKNLLSEYSELAVVVTDIDHFKAINDTHGHIVGDKILKRVAKLLSTDLRTKDIAARWGGEEFVLIFPETSLQQAADICQRLRACVESTEFYGKDNQQPIRVTMSFGVSVEKTENLQFKHFIENADKAVYQAKANGRNRVEISE